MTDKNLSVGLCHTSSLQLSGLPEYLDKYLACLASPRALSRYENFEETRSKLSCRAVPPALPTSHGNPSSELLARNHRIEQGCFSDVRLQGRDLSSHSLDGFVVLDCEECVDRREQFIAALDENPRRWIPRPPQSR